MLYVILKKDVRSRNGRTYAKNGWKLKVLFKNATHYICEIGRFNIPVFFNQVSREITTYDDEKEIYLETTDREESEGIDSFNENQTGEDFDYC